MKMGRPTKLTPEIIAKAQEYIDGGYKDDELVPTIAGLAVYIGIRKSTIYEWGKENSNFSDFLDAVMAKQEKFLLKGGMAGEYNSTITKLMLTKHGYSDKQETELSGPAGGPVELAVIDATQISTDALREIMAAKDAAVRG
jgi:hypothetical protein